MQKLLEITRSISPGVTLHCSQEIPCIRSKAIELLARFRDRGTADHLQEILLNALERVGLHLKDVRGITTDAASVMIELGRNLKEAVAPQAFYHHRCFNHGIHLAVMDILEDDDLDIESLLKRADQEENALELVDPEHSSNSSTDGGKLRYLTLRLYRVLYCIPSFFP